MEFETDINMEQAMSELFPVPTETLHVQDRGTPEELKAAFNQYATKHDFRPGDLVQWKKGMKNCRWPAYGRPAVVMELVPGRRDENGNRRNEHEYEPCGLRVGVLLDDDILNGFWMDENRFEPYAHEDAPETSAP